MNWHDHRYLATGSPRQQQAYAVLLQLGVWHTLRAYSPVLAGTIPLGIDTPTSDLDVICEVPDNEQPRFAALLHRAYAHLAGYSLRHKSVRGQSSVVCGFEFGGFAVEVFGQGRPVRQQYAYRHLIVEHALLQAGGAAWLEAVRALKLQGLKTEPAFAQLLQLPGDPYEALLTLEGKSSEELATYLASLSPQKQK
ncbi:DUF4269 domain-containing protein [Solirubrum puertoriconensis]|uniref:DUF4269 domain-containing protein n=1 Tax=Solirubrum puertoriconensis TaxID=1751427 RepID=A0A9X0HM73_SOLP1|nr:DUF4269 domain-containing protein [Solirubrum puertoriconensis]KUG08498.1 hypothetical protein ASU33_10065 [Solirubrum puertoriconensis]